MAMTCKHGKTVFSNCPECDAIVDKRRPSPAAGGEKCEVIEIGDIVEISDYGHGYDGKAGPVTRLYEQDKSYGLIGVSLFNGGQEFCFPFKFAKLVSKAKPAPAPAGKEAVLCKCGHRQDWHVDGGDCGYHESKTGVACNCKYFAPESRILLDMASGEWCDGCGKMTDVFISIPMANTHACRLCRDCCDEVITLHDNYGATPHPSSVGELVVGQKALVECTVASIDHHGKALVDVGAMCNIKVPLTSIHPAPGGGKEVANVR